MLSCARPGVDNGDQVEVQFAVPGKKGQTRVLIPVEVEPHPVFRREGADVHITLQLKLSQVRAGACLREAFRVSSVCLWARRRGVSRPVRVDDETMPSGWLGV